MDSRGIHSEAPTLNTEPLTTSSDRFCESPACPNAVEPLGDGWRRTERRFCSDGCKMDAWAIRRTAKLFELTVERMVDILQAEKRFLNAKKTDSGESEFRFAKASKTDSGETKP